MSRAILHFFKKSVEWHYIRLMPILVRLLPIAYNWRDTLLYALPKTSVASFVFVRIHAKTLDKSGDNLYNMNRVNADLG